MTKGLDSAQQKAAEKTQKRMSKAGNKVLLDRLVAMPAMMALSGLDDIRDCIVFCDMSTTEDLLRVEPISIDAFFQGDAPEGLEDLSEGSSSTTRGQLSSAIASQAPRCTPRLFAGLEVGRARRLP